MRKVISSLLTTVLLFAFAFSALASNGDQAAGEKKADATAKKKAPSNNTNFVGDITAGSATSITVKTKTGDKTAAIDDKTKIKHEGDGSAATAADLKNGERAHIWATKDKAGNWTATTIRVGKLAPKKTSTKKDATKKDG